MKTLYFEGAGWPKTEEGVKTGVGNCRIRTAFHLKNGKRVYLEIIGTKVTKHMSKDAQKYKYASWIDFCHYITNEEPNEDCNKYAMREIERNVRFEYNKQNILEFVNSLGADFDRIRVLPNLAGYRVFASSNGYYYGDAFTPNPKAYKVARKIENYLYKIKKALGEKYPCIYLSTAENDPTKLELGWNGKKYIIDALNNNWQKTIKNITKNEREKLSWN